MNKFEFAELTNISPMGAVLYAGIFTAWKFEETKVGFNGTPFPKFVEQNKEEYKKTFGETGWHGVLKILAYKKELV